MSFGFCSGLEFTQIPVNLKSINPYTFYRCDSLETIDLCPKHINLEERFFYECYSIANVINLNDPNQKVFGNKTFFEFSLDQKFFLLTLNFFKQFHDQMRISALPDSLRETCIDKNQEDGKIMLEALIKNLFEDEVVFRALIKSKDSSLAYFLLKESKNPSFFEKHLKPKCTSHHFLCKIIKEYRFFENTEKM